MKIITKLILIISLLISSLNNYSQVPDSVYYNRLFYLCKTWGHVKYFHTETANGNVNWDDELLMVVSGVKNAPDNSSFNDSLLIMLKNAGEMGVSTSYMPNVPDSLNLNNDLSWMQNPIFSDSVRSILDTIQSRFRPQSNVYVTQTYYNGPPSFAIDDQYDGGPYYPVENMRVLSLFRYWNIINYFFPYKDIMDQEWDTTLVEMIPYFIEATDDLSYNLAVKRLTTRIVDSHGQLNSYIFQLWDGHHHTPFLTKFIDTNMVISKVLPEVTEVTQGDIILEIDGLDINEIRDSLREFSAGSNDEFVNMMINKMIMLGDYGDFSITVDDGISTRTETLIRNIVNYERLIAKTDPIWKDTLVNGYCNFGIVDMSRLVTDDVETMFDELWDTDAIIFDIRGYPNATLWYIVNYLYNTSINIANFTFPDVEYPGRLYWDYEFIGTGTSDPYEGNIIILHDINTISQAEYTCMGLEQFDEAIKIGSTTAAADGNISAIYLPGHIFTAATFLGVYYPDYTPTQRIGIIPDYEVNYSINGLKNNRDEVLDFALNCDFVNIDHNMSDSDISFYPNPVSNSIRYDISDNFNKDLLLLQIYDLYGRLVLTKKVLPQTEGEIDLVTLNSGTFVIRCTGTNSSYTHIFTKN